MGLSGLLWHSSCSSSDPGRTVGCSIDRVERSWTNAWLMAATASVDRRSKAVLHVCTRDLRRPLGGLYFSPISSSQRCSARAARGAFVHDVISIIFPRARWYPILLYNLLYQQRSLPAYSRSKNVLVFNMYHECHSCSAHTYMVYTTELLWVN